MKHRFLPLISMKKTSLLPVLAFFFVLPILLSSCSVHEWPEEIVEQHSFMLYLDFDTDLPLHKEVYYTRGDDDTRAMEGNYDIRYIVNVYKVKDANDDSRSIDHTLVFTRPYDINPDYSVEIKLPEGNYRFRVWADYLVAGTKTDLHYNTSDFGEIKINGANGHPGNTEFRDAFNGTTYATVTDPLIYEINHGTVPDNSARVPMKRPMGRYEFISTDMEEFLGKVIEATENEDLIKSFEKMVSTKGDDILIGDHLLTRDEISDAIGLDKYRVVFSYNAFMPSSYNLYTDKPSDSSTGVKYEGKMQIGEDGMKLGFDYVLTNEQTSMNLNMQIYNADGDMIASTGGVEVPVVRSKNTVVKGAFLTVTSGGGVSVKPDFDGEYNIEIQ